MEEKMKDNSQINYLCDGKVEGCKKRICYMNGGDPKSVCRHTKDIRHAKNFYKPYPRANFREKESFQGNKENVWMQKVITICLLASTLVALISILILCIQR